MRDLKPKKSKTEQNKAKQSRGLFSTVKAMMDKTIDEGKIQKRRLRSSLHAVWETELIQFLATLAVLQ